MQTITNLFVPSDSGADLAEEFNYVKHWAEENRTVINIARTKEIVFKRPNTRLYITSINQSINQFICTVTRMQLHNKARTDRTTRPH